LVVVFVSGCTDSASADLTKTFSKGSISFNYLSDWFEMPYKDKGVKSYAQIIGLVGSANLDYDLTVQKISSSTIKQVKDETMQFNKLNYNAKIINETPTTVNGMSAYQVVYTEKNPDVSDTRMKTSSYLIQKGNTVYLMCFRAYSVDNFDKYL